jgi:hypothetical protein
MSKWGYEVFVLGFVVGVFSMAVAAILIVEFLA